MEQGNDGNGQTPIRVLVVDDQRLVRDGIVSLLHVQKELEVVGTAADGQEAVEQAFALKPDVVLMDVRMPIMNGVDATAEILRQQPTCCILMLTTFDDDAYVRDALRSGARGYLLKDMPASDLTTAILAASKGVYQLDASVIERFIAPDARPQKIEPVQKIETVEGPSETVAEAKLTRREQEILHLIATGATNREVAEHLIISEGTVKNYLARLFNRLGLRDRTQAVIYAREHGLL
ncbi:DNA-binding response regulator [Reticulibacter mediterranei]|uniref:DNA-binding response regulator n=1 Tax=Reticulibacter mediterranei TaxID=2778369 RepID=A0A8J3J0G1_9CHLR|nr:response regulator transcription factor [Reticulibacter mediterranei]GHP00078.1 DNA-binding response regulator [Reticulibacter mediterranei]